MSIYQQIIRQKNNFCLFSEYYFSPDNLQKDFFIRRKMDPEGFLPISLIASFPRMRQLTLDMSVIVGSLRDSERVELSDDGLKVNKT